MDRSYFIYPTATSNKEKVQVQVGPSLELLLLLLLQISAFFINFFETFPEIISVFLLCSVLLFVF